jgi:hypothetical protein
MLPETRTLKMPPVTPPGARIVTFGSLPIGLLLIALLAALMAFMYFHGAASRVGASETAFALREELYEFFIQAGWADDGQERHVQWTRQSYRALERFMNQRGYANFLADEGTARVRAAYGPNYQRLAVIKTKFE